MGVTASCCQEDTPDESPVPKEVIETQHACDEPQPDVPEEPIPSHSKPNTHSRILQMPHFDVDAEILRGIELQKSLQRFGKLWRESPLDMKMEERTGLWDKSHPVDGYDVFLSHTWLTPGRWKVPPVCCILGDV